jgi:predicted Fe-S protein YdhL (DUF1289 family)
MPSEPASPCVNICRMENDICQGCGRRIEEIAAWPTASATARRIIIAAAKVRLGSTRAARDA